ncbi:hypothetical protein SCLCIDRAFT_24901 [Scleroderma citrinum Foug A]|uniref:Uncharacterized protein n=1 Tax=Scleroderma citrinum Foug A TaxID=1036808 RepID=A0A0C3ACI6_9AGAM|nr:hypothetical protein SCLCIDRAFT_24901 [Scleroderma citrinum Foug A]
MVETWERNKTAHPGQLVAPKPCKSREEVAAERAAKATAIKKKANEQSDKIAGLASMELHIQEESQQAMSQAARPPSSQARGNVLHNVGKCIVKPSSQDTNDSPVNQLDNRSASRNHNEPAQRKVAVPKPKLREEIRSACSALMQEKEDLEETGQQEKHKVAADLDNLQQNKRAKPYKPFGLVQRCSPSTTSHLLREQSPDEISQPLSSTLCQSQTPTDRFSLSRTPSLSAMGSKPPSHTPKPLTCQYTTADITSMPVDDYGGFHDKDEIIEQDMISNADKEFDNKLVIQDHPTGIGNSNATLPQEISPHFQDVFIPTLLAYCSTIPNPWFLQLQDIIPDLWKVVFPRVPYNEQLFGTGTITFRVARQCIYDWRSKFAETVDKVVAAWFDSDEFSDSEGWGAWAEWAVNGSLGFPFIFKYLKSNNKGVGAFHAPLILQTLAFHYTKTANAVQCPQIDSYPHGALTLSTVGVERAISMWAESGCCTEESKAAAGNFSGDQQSKWDHSSASYAQSIEGLSNRSWDEIETSTLEFATRGRRFKATGMNGDARASIVDCDSEDEDTSTSADDKEFEHAADEQTRDWD